jgi:hypothetical protein
MSLRHTRLLRIVNMMERGEMPHEQRAVFWKGKHYALDDLEREGVAVRFNRPGTALDCRRMDARWDRIWRPMTANRKESHRWRNAVGRRLRKLYFAPLARGVTPFFSEAQLQRLRQLALAPDGEQSFMRAPRKLTFEEFKKRWIR